MQVSTDVSMEVSLWKCLVGQILGYVDNRHFPRNFYKHFARLLMRGAVNASGRGPDPTWHANVKTPATERFPICFPASSSLP
jgi:hypothetical protein